jgi:hypothetical protein
MDRDMKSERDLDIKRGLSASIQQHLVGNYRINLKNI